MTNKIIQFLAVKYPLPIFGILGSLVLIAGIVMLVYILGMSQVPLGFAILTMAFCLSGVFLILVSIILFALSELRQKILKEKWYNS